MRTGSLIKILITTIISTFVFSNTCFEINAPKSPHYTFTDKIYVRTFDNLSIAGNLFTPKNQLKKSPVIIFVNSWFLEEHEYFKQAKKFAEKGYIVFSYSARGWGCSDGTINVMGEKDLSDLSRVIDWIRDHTNADMENIGMSGISYGSGMTLMGMAHDPRIKTGVAMSTWGSLTDSLFGNDTLRSFWTSLLVGSGFFTGEIDPEIFELFKDIFDQDGINEARVWAEKRSPLNVIEKINKRNAPVFISNSFGDNLFQPNSVINFYNKLTVPKRLELNQGTHASAEGLGLILSRNYTFEKTHEWFDYWLKGITPKNNLNEISLLTSLKHKRESYQDQGLLKPENDNTIFHLSPHTLVFKGALNRLNTNLSRRNDYIRSGVETLATTGIPVASAIMNAHFKLPVMRYSRLLNTPYSLSYESSELSEEMKIRGIPKIKIHVTPESDEIQLVAYLYEVNQKGVAKLITHGVMTKAFLKPKKEIVLDFELVATAYDIAKGNKLLLAFDTVDPLYLPILGFSHDLNINFGPFKRNTITFQNILNVKEFK